MTGGNLFTDLPSAMPEEVSTTLAEAAGVRVERIVSHGHASPEGSGTTRSSTSGSCC